MSRMLSKMNLISVVQQLPKEDIETIQGYVEMIENENKKYKEVIDKAIEYIESKEYEYGDEEQDNYIYDIGFDEVNELLDILKGMK